MENLNRSPTQPVRPGVEIDGISQRVSFDFWLRKGDSQFLTRKRSQRFGEATRLLIFEPVANSPNRFDRVTL